MTATEPQVSLNGRYSIRQTCDLLGMHRNTLRQKTKSGLITCFVTKDGHTRYKGVEILKYYRAEL